MSKSPYLPANQSQAQLNLFVGCFIFALGVVISFIDKHISAPSLSQMLTGPVLIFMGWSVFLNERHPTIAKIIRISAWVITAVAVISVGWLLWSKYYAA